MLTSILPVIPQFSAWSPKSYVPIQINGIVDNVFFFTYHKYVSNHDLRMEDFGMNAYLKQAHYFYPATAVYDPIETNPNPNP